jgi:hypothetical protein
MLSGTFMPKTTGLYTLHIENTRDVVSATCIYNFIDNIHLAPDSIYQKIYLLGSDCNISCKSGGTVQFKLLTANAYPNEYYWILMSVSGTYPGFDLSNVTVPLNWDALLEYGLMYPNFPGSVEFFGKLDGFGQATASLTLPPDPNQVLVGLPLHFAFVVTSPGPSTPIMASSNPVHIKYVPAP